MLSRRVSKSLLIGISFILLGVMLPKCHGQTRKESSQVPAATSLIQISMRPDTLVYNSNAQANLEEFKIFKNTQAQLIKTPFVLTAALRKPEIASLSIVRQEEVNPVAWLQQNLEVSFPGDGEIMKISLSASNHREAVKLLRAVVDAYLSEVVETERNVMTQKLAALEEVLASKEREIRQRRITLKTLAEQLGTVDQEILKIQSQLAIQQLALYQKELFRVNSELRKLKMEREVTRAALKRHDKRNAPKASNSSISGVRQAILRDQIADADVRIAITSDNAVELKKEVDSLKEEFQRIGLSSVEVEMMRKNLHNLEEVVRDIAKERQAFEIEIKSRPRIRLLQRAELSP